MALSGDGQVALVGAPFASGENGAAYLYTESAGSWPTIPAATFTGSLGQRLGSSGPSRRDGQVALVGGPGALLDGGTANVYSESAGSWKTGPVAAFRERGRAPRLFGGALGRREVALVGADTAGPGGATFVYTSPG